MAAEAKYIVATKEQMTNYLKKLEDEFTVQLNEAKVSKKLIVIYFSCSDCPRCEDMTPFFDDLAASFNSKVIFLNIDGFKLEAVAKKFDVKTHPTFVLMKGEDTVDRVHSSRTIEETIRKQLGEPPCPQGQVTVYSPHESALWDYTAGPPDEDEDSEHDFPFSEEEEDGDEGQVIRCHTDEECTVQLKNAIDSNKLIVIFFTAPDCTQCQEIAPFIASLAKTYKSKVIVFEVDGFELQRVAKKYNVKTYPNIVLEDCGLKAEFDLRRKNKEQIEGEIEEAIEDCFNPEI